MEQKRVFKLRDLKIVTFILVILDFATAIISPILVKYGYSLAAKSFVFLLCSVLIPTTGLFMILTFVYALKASYSEKRTAQQELAIKQRFWGRMLLLALSVMMMLAYIALIPLDLYGLVLMFLLFVISVFLGPLLGRSIIKK